MCKRLAQPREPVGTSHHSEEKQETPTESSEGPAIARKQQKETTQISRACKGARRDAGGSPSDLIKLLGLLGKANKLYAT